MRVSPLGTPRSEVRLLPTGSQVHHKAKGLRKANRPEAELGGGGRPVLTAGNPARVSHVGVEGEGVIRRSDPVPTYSVYRPRSWKAWQKDETGKAKFAGLAIPTAVAEVVRSVAEGVGLRLERLSPRDEVSGGATELSRVRQHHLRLHSTDRPSLGPAFE